MTLRGRKHRRLQGVGLHGLAFAVLLLSSAGDARAAAMGSFSALSYNVAGLPLGLSSSTPNVNNFLMSPRLNAFDLVAVQEDFGFHQNLVFQATHPFQSVKDTTDTALAVDLAMMIGLPPPGLGDGLNRLSRIPFENHMRITWNDCFGELTNGSDCLAPKGFAVARHELAPGAFMDVYNWHADASDAPEDLAARRSEVRQLYTFIQSFSAGQAVLVLGDTNSRYTRAGDILPEMLAATGLSDVWVDLAAGGVTPGVGPKLDACVVNGPAGGDCERIDKIFYRSGGGVTLVPTAYEVPSDDFKDFSGLPLSDHEPVVARFQWAVPEPSPSALVALGIVLLALAVAAAPRRSP